MACSTPHPCAALTSLYDASKQRNAVKAAKLGSVLKWLSRKSSDSRTAAIEPAYVEDRGRANKQWLAMYISMPARKHCPAEKLES
jgi:hypothetical protein